MPTRINNEKIAAKPRVLAKYSQTIRTIIAITAEIIRISSDLDLWFTN